MSYEESDDFDQESQTANAVHALADYLKGAFERNIVSSTEMKIEVDSIIKGKDLSELLISKYNNMIK